jgi:exodeoxyribonuclease VII small subunit
MNALGSTTAKAVSGDAGDASAHADVDFGSYEQALGELERIVLSMEAGQMPLDGLLEGYRRGAALLAHCRGRLEAVEEQVRLLEDGQLKPWSEGA